MAAEDFAGNKRMSDVIDITRWEIFTKFNRNTYCDWKVYFIHEMSSAECNDALSRATYGRLACSRDNQPMCCLSTLSLMGTTISIASRLSDRRALELLEQRVMWWEPAYISREHMDKPHCLTPIFFA